MEKKFKKRMESLDDVFTFVDQYIGANSIDSSISFKVKFAIEELFTNMVKYNPSSDEVSISLVREDKRLVVSLIDFAAEPFDLTKAAEVNTDQPLENRRPGGLGIHLIKKMVDEINYEFADRQSKTTFVTRLEQ